MTITIIKKVIPEEILLRYGFTMHRKKLEVAEELPNFSDTIPPQQVYKIDKQNEYLL